MTTHTVVMNIGELVESSSVLIDPGVTVGNGSDVGSVTVETLDVPPRPSCSRAIPRSWWQNSTKNEETALDRDRQASFARNVFTAHFVRRSPLRGLTSFGRNVFTAYFVRRSHLRGLTSFGRNVFTAHFVRRSHLRGLTSFGLAFAGRESRDRARSSDARPREASGTTGGARPKGVRRPIFEPEPDVLAHVVRCARLVGFKSPGDSCGSRCCSPQECAGRDLNPGHELGRLRSYH